MTFIRSYVAEALKRSVGFSIVVVEGLMKKVVLIACSAVFLFLSSTSARACWCRGRDPEEKISSAVKKELRQSALVFSGVAVESNGSGLRFSVERLWKGKATKEIIFDSVINSTSSDGKERFIDSCARQFEVGKKYLVYVYREKGHLFVSKCSRTQPIESASKDIIELDVLVKKPQFVSGLQPSVRDSLKPEIQRALGADSPKWFFY